MSPKDLIDRVEEEANLAHIEQRIFDELQSLNAKFDSVAKSLGTLTSAYAATEQWKGTTDSTLSALKEECRDLQDKLHAQDLVIAQHKVAMTILSLLGSGLVAAIMSFILRR